MILSKKLIHIFASLMILSISILLSGCSFKDIDKRNFVVAIGIDPVENGEKKYKVTLKIALPISSIKDASKATFTYLSHESDSMSDAIRIIESHNDKTIDFGHTRLIVINEKLLENNLQNFMDYFVRRGDIQLISWIAAAKPSAEKILQVEPTTESIASLALFNFFDNNGTDSPFVITTFLFEFRRQFHTQGLETVIPLIESNEDDTELIINKSVIVKEQHEPLSLTAIQTLYFNSIANDAKGYSYKANLNDDLSILLYVRKFKMTYKINTEKGQKPTADIKINLVGSVVESTKPLSIYHLDKYDELIANDLKKVVKDLLTTAQEKNMDPIGFGLRYRATRLNDKNTFAEWEEIYPDLDFKIDFKVNIKSIGAVM